VQPRLRNIKGGRSNSQMTRINKLIKETYFPHTLANQKPHIAVLRTRLLGNVFKSI
jgi:hypothetical protein